MKTKLQTLGCFLTALVVFSTSAFAGEPANNSSTNNDNAPAVGTTILVNPGTTDNVITAATTANTESNAILLDNTNNIDNTQAIASYHHGSSGGSGDGIEGKNMIYGGVGFVSISSLLTSAYTNEGYTSSHIPPLTIAYERGLSEHVGFGVQIVYTSFSLSLDNQEGDPFFNNGNAYTYSDKLKLSGIGFGLIGTYHFVTSGKIDPYFGYGFGYEVFSFSWTTTDPNTAIDGNVNPGNISGGLPWFNIFVGSRFFITDHVGAYVDFGWHGLVGGIINLGIVAKF